MQCFVKRRLQRVVVGNVVRVMLHLRRWSYGQPPEMFDEFSVGNRNIVDYFFGTVFKNINTICDFIIFILFGYNIFFFSFFFLIGKGGGSSSSATVCSVPYSSIKSDSDSLVYIFILRSLFTYITSTFASWFV